MILKTCLKLSLISIASLFVASSASANQITELSSDASLSQYFPTSPVTVSWKVRVQATTNDTTPINAVVRIKQTGNVGQPGCRNSGEQSILLQYNTVDGAYASYSTHTFIPVENWCLGTYTTEITVENTTSTFNRTFTVITPPSNPIQEHNIVDDPTECTEEESETECQERKEQEKEEQKLAEETQKQKEQAKQQKLNISKLKVTRKKMTFTTKNKLQKLKVTFKTKKTKKTFSVKVKKGKASRKIALKKGTYQVTFQSGQIKTVKNIKVR